MNTHKTLNEIAITKFLAGKLNPKHIRVNFNSYFVISSNKVDKPEIFDPMNDISHAFMVEDEIAKTDDQVKEKYSVDIAYQTRENFEFDLYLHVCRHQCYPETTLYSRRPRSGYTGRN